MIRLFQTTILALTAIAAIAAITGCAGVRKNPAAPPAAAQFDGCRTDLPDSAITEEFRQWFLSDLLTGLTPEKLTASSHDTVVCRLQFSECDPADPEGSNNMTLAWKRSAIELTEQVFGILKDELSAALDTVRGGGRGYEISIDRVDPGLLDGGAGFGKHFGVCGGGGPEAYPVISLSVPYTLGECYGYNVFAFVRTGGGYKLMGADIRNDDGFVVAMYRSGSADYFLARGSLCYDRGGFDCAVEMFGKVIDMEPGAGSVKSVTAYILRGNVYYEKGEYARAAEDWSEAIKLDPHNAEAHGLRASAYQSMGEFEKVIADAGNAIRLEPLNPTAYNTRANARVETGGYEEALEDYEEAARLLSEVSSDMSDALLYNLSLLYACMGDIPKADSLYGEALKIRATYPGPHHGYEDELKQYAAYMERHPDNAVLHYHRGVIYFRMEDYAKAAADFEAALRLDPEHALAKRYLEQAASKNAKSEIRNAE